MKERVFRIANPACLAIARSWRFCCTNRVKGVLPPFPQMGLADRHCDRYAKSGVTFEDSDTDLGLGNLPLKVPCHQRLAKQLHTML